MNRPGLHRALAEAVLAEVIAACDPARLVHDALASPPIAARLAGRRLLALAVGKAALAMARGAGPVSSGVAIVPTGGAGPLPPGWHLLEASHPVPDHHSLAAGAALLQLAHRATPDDVLLALLSGGASALAELPAAALTASTSRTDERSRSGLPLSAVALAEPATALTEPAAEVPSFAAAALAELGAPSLPAALLAEQAATMTSAMATGENADRVAPDLPPRAPAALAEFAAIIRQVMATGAPIDEINAVRGAMSAIKAGRLALASGAPVITLAVSDVIGDPLAVIGSGPTVGPWLASPGVEVDDGAVAIWHRARAVLSRLGISPPAILDREPPARRVVRNDHAVVIAPMASAAHAAVHALAARGITAHLVEKPVSGDVEEVAQLILRQLATLRTDAADIDAQAIVLWGEPTIRVPQQHGSGGRAQQLALLLAREVQGGSNRAFVVGTDGIDGPPPPDRASPAGAWVDGATWDAIVAAGVDPGAALATCDAGTALSAVGALVVTGPTGINHADLILVV